MRESGEGCGGPDPAVGLAVIPTAHHLDVTTAAAATAPAASVAAATTTAAAAATAVSAVSEYTDTPS